jgi:hypothetical protein
MAAWTLPDRIADWCQILTTALDRRSRKYFLTIVLGMLLGSGRRTVSCWLRAAGVTDDWQRTTITSCRLSDGPQNALLRNCCIWQ